MSTTPIVRLATAADPRALARVQVASWQRAYRGIVPLAFLANYTVAKRARRWEAILAEPLPGARTWVCEVEGRVEGLASVLRSRDGDASLGELGALYVHPEHWGTGMGHALHQIALSHLDAEGYGGALLWVLADNERATRFYGAHDWQLDGADKTVDFGGTGLRELRMAHPLGSAPPCS
ncbi:MAG: GNAT superfamily N-acetyltransferase [Myxococcota bacterium]|jgi:GNAT superfamily N-acetyltransferase